MEIKTQFSQIWGDVRQPLFCFGTTDGHAALLFRNRAADALCPRETDFPEMLSDGEASALLGQVSELLSHTSCSPSAKDPLFLHIGSGVYFAVLFAWNETCICLLQDVSDYYRDVERRLNEAVMANRAKTSFLSEMSHDIRTPMNAIIGMTDIALTERETPSRIREYLSKIKTASRHMMSIINEVLDMSRIESGKIILQPEEAEIADILHEILIVAKPQADAKNQTFTLEIGRIDHERIVADTLRFKQICLNLLSNAIKFTPDGGTVSMHVEMTQEHRDADTVTLHLLVRDTGIGMSKEFLSRVFMPFEREQSLTISKIQGTGLGTSIARNLTELMGGTISVESEPGKGACFTVEIPFPAAPSHLDIYRQALCGKCLLLMDSSAKRAETVINMAENIGLSVDLAVSAEQAVFYINDAALSDYDYFAFLTADKVDGVELMSFLPEIRKRMGSDFPILLLTESDWTQTEYMFTRAGVDAFIPLPLFRSRLYAGIYAFTEQGQSADEAPGSGHHFDGKRILLVEDNELNREIAQAILEMTGLTIETAGDGQKALDQFRAHPPFYYDLVFMDIQMPVMNGLDAARALRALDRPDATEVPIVAMTANAFVEDVKNALDAGMNAHVSKPLDMEVVFSCLERFLGR